MTKEEARKLLDDTKVCISDNSEEIQKKLFSIGYSWKEEGKNIQHKNAPFLYIEKDGYLLYGCGRHEEEGVNEEYRKISASFILNIKLEKDVKIVNRGEQKLPKYETLGSAGMDIRANIEDDIILYPLERRLIPTDLFIALPEGLEAQIRPRSGLALKFGVTVLNSPGTIDSDYRGEIKVLLVNLSNHQFTIKKGERIAQMVISDYQKVNFVEVKDLDKTERGTGGYGHTGLE
jgi:dUTP pyrophosphatase